MCKRINKIIVDLIFSFVFGGALMTALMFESYLFVNKITNILVWFYFSSVLFAVVYAIIGFVSSSWKNGAKDKKKNNS